MGRKRKNIELQEEGPKEEEKGKKQQALEKMELSAQEREEHDRLDREYFDRLPPGFRFLPTGDELIIDYLSKKVSNLPLPKNRIREANIYTLHPQQLTSMYKLHREKEWYFFTPRSKKYPNGQRPDRSAGNGFWKATGADSNIPEIGITIGKKKTLVYYEGKAKDKSKQMKTDWIMHEYKLHKGNNTNNNVGPVAKKDAGDMTLDEWVLCKIYNKTTKPKEPHDIEQEEEPVPNPNPNEVDSNPNEVGFVNAVGFPTQEVGFVNAVGFPTQEVGFVNAVDFSMQNEQVPNPSTEQRPNGAHFVNGVGFPVQNEQVLNPNTKQGPDGTGFFNISTFVLHNEQVPNPNNTKQGQDGAGFDNTVSFSMQHNEQTSNPNTKHDLVFRYLSNDHLGYHENVLFSSSRHSAQYGMLPYYDHQAMDMHLLETSSTYHIHSQDTLQGPTEVFDYPPPLDYYKDERQEPLDIKDGEVPQRLDDTTARPNQAPSSKETKTK